MIRLEIRREGSVLPKVFLDGVRLEGASASTSHRLSSKSNPEDEQYTVRVYGNQENISKLLSVPLGAVDERIRRVTANLDVSLDDFKVSLTVSKKDKKWASVEFVLYPNVRNWKNPWSIAEFGRAFYECVNDMDLDENGDSDDERLRHGPFGQVSLMFPLEEERTTMGIELDQRGSEIKNLRREQRSILRSVTLA